MKTKIFDKLKQGYASLGLGDELLMAHAETLASLGLVTDDNIDGIVAAQKSFLEGLQKSNDKRVSDALKRKETEHTSKLSEVEKAAKSEKDALNAKLAELQKQLDEAKKTTTPPDNGTNKEEFAKMLEAASAESKEAIKALQAQVEEMKKGNEKSQESIKQLQEEKAALEAKQKAAERQQLILTKAKELGIPQYRIDEGFTIAEDADENAIGTYLTTVANNIKVNSLPNNQHFSMANKEVTKAETDNLASKIIG